MKALTLASTSGCKASSLQFRCLSTRRACMNRPHRALAAQRRRSSIARADASDSAPSTGLQPELAQALDNFVAEHKVVVFMKGEKENPQCGFSATVCQPLQRGPCALEILNNLSVPFVTVNILEDEQLRSGIKAWSNWPTFPQLYIDGEFFGGCDITIQAFQSGELQEALEKAMNE